MARKKTVTKTGKRVAKRSSSGKALTNVRDELTGYAAAVVASETSGGTFISTQGGRFTYKGATHDGPLRVVVVDYAHVNTWYSEAYDPKASGQIPACFAIVKSPDTIDEADGLANRMAPHPKSAEPQSDGCADCWANAFGSAPNKRGKACRNQRRLAIIPADNVDKVTSDAELAMLNIPPSSLRLWGGYVSKLAATGLPPFAVITDLEINKLENGHEIVPRFVEELPASNVREMLKLREGIVELVTAPFEASQKLDDDRKDRPHNKRRAKVGTLRNSKKKKSKTRARGFTR